MAAVIFLLLWGSDSNAEDSNDFDVTGALAPIDETQQGGPKKGTGPRPLTLRVTTWNE